MHLFIKPVAEEPPTSEQTFRRIQNEYEYNQGLR